MTTLLAAAAVVACGSETGSGTQATPTPSASSSPSPTPSGPATADLTFAGDPALTAPLTVVSIECLVPRLEGTYILVSGMPQGQPKGGLTVSLAIRDGSVSVNVGSGSAASLIERDFSGTGISGFDASRGVHLSAALIETTTATTKKGNIGVLTSVSGSVSCGNQTMGTSTIMVTGTTKEGAVDFTLSPARVVCRNGASGYFIGINGIVNLGATRALVFVTLGQTSLQVALERQDGVNHFYLSQGQGVTSVSSAGGHVDGSATEQNAAGQPGTVNVTGDATCGSSATY